MRAWPAADSTKRFARWRERLRRGAREATPWIFGIVGVALLGGAASRWIKAGQEQDAFEIPAPAQTSDTAVPVRADS